MMRADAETPAPATIEAAAVTLKRARHTVLDQVTIHVPPGAVVGLVGRNGAGKSTLMRCLVGLSVPDLGACRLLGESSLDLSDAARARLGYVSQTADLFDGLDALGHFKRIGTLYPNWLQDRALELARRLALPLETRANQLSEGDQQKLSVVLALAHDPDLMILDEPVASLDPLTRRDFMRVLFERRFTTDPPRTVLISSHLLADLERVVTHVMFLREGRLQLQEEWDVLAEHARLVVLPEEADAAWIAPAGIWHRRVATGCTRWVVDARRMALPAGLGQPLTLDDLFEELNA